MSGQQLRCAAGCIIVAVFPGCAPARGDCPLYQPTLATGTVQSTQLTEISGLAVSRQHPGVLWVHNDSGDLPRIYAVNTSGATLGTYMLEGATHVDWEDMALGPGPLPGVSYLYIGDIGDNPNTRPEIRVYRVPEPIASATQQPVVTTLTNIDTITLKYPDGPRDAETLMVDTNGDLYIVSKRVTAKGRVYRAAFPQPTTGVSTLEFVAELPWGSVSGEGGATGGDIAPDGSAVAIRRYAFNSPKATLWLRPPGTPLASVFAQPGCSIPIALDLQGETLAFDGYGRSYYTISEGTSPAVYRYPQQKQLQDINGDGAVNQADLGVLLAAYSKCAGQPGYYAPADLDSDGCVEQADLGTLLAGFEP